MNFVERATNNLSDRPTPTLSHPSKGAVSSGFAPKDGCRRPKSERTLNEIHKSSLLIVRTGRFLPFGTVGYNGVSSI